MNIVVSNTTPLRYLTEIGCMQLIPCLFGKIIIPFAVLSELTHKKAPKEIQNSFSPPPEWLDIQDIHNNDSTLQMLDPGEQEAILLAEKLQASAILLDDGHARRIANSRNLHSVGTLRILKEGANQKLVDWDQVIQRLQKTTFRVKPDLIKKVWESGAPDSRSK